MQGVSDIDPESKSESTLCEQRSLKASEVSSRTEQTSTVQEITASVVFSPMYLSPKAGIFRSNDSVALKPSPGQVVKGAAGSLHLDMESNSTKRIQSPHQSLDEGNSAWDLRGCVCSLLCLLHSSQECDMSSSSLSTDLYPSTQPSHVSHSPLSDSHPSSCPDTPGGASQIFSYSPENSPPAILCASPCDYSEPPAGTAVIPADEIQGDVAKRTVQVGENSECTLSCVHAPVANLLGSHRIFYSSTRRADANGARSNWAGGEQ